MSLVAKYSAMFLQQIKNYITQNVGPKNIYKYTQEANDVQKINTILNGLEKLKVSNVHLVLPTKNDERNYRIDPKNLPKVAYGKIGVKVTKNGNVRDGIVPYDVVFDKLVVDHLKGGDTKVFNLDFLIVADVKAATPPSPAAAHVNVPIAALPPKPSGIDPCTIPKGYLCKLEGNKYVCTKMAGGSSYQDKYLKYKAKYLQLKNQLNL
jgi:hypothetical protein